MAQLVSSMNSVQQKISCVYETGVVDEPSKKRPHQPFKVTATRNLLPKALADDIASARATEKLDGTCCFVTEFKGQPCLWARHDRKPSKVGEKRFAQYKRLKAKHEPEGTTDSSDFKWDFTKDFKEVPENWAPAHGHRVCDGMVMPDNLGHTPGWIPVVTGSRQHCWHLQAVNPLPGTALILRQSEDNGSDLLLESQPLSQLCGQTLELIGTNINGNPYNLGSKKNPFHVLVAHGNLTLSCPNPLDHDALVTWMASDSESNQVEGVVWHCHNGQMYKLHRHHLNMRWPDKIPELCHRKVKVQVPVEEEGDPPQSPKPKDLFAKLTSLSGQEFDSLLALCEALAEVVS